MVEGKFMTEQAMLDEGMTEILGLIVSRFAMVGEVGDLVMFLRYESKEACGSDKEVLRRETCKVPEVPGVGYNNFCHGMRTLFFTSPQNPQAPSHI